MLVRNLQYRTGTRHSTHVAWGMKSVVGGDGCFVYGVKRGNHDVRCACSTEGEKRSLVNGDENEARARVVRYYIFVIVAEIQKRKGKKIWEGIDYYVISHNELESGW
jgi:hypothetical protein